MSYRKLTSIFLFIGFFINPIYLFAQNPEPIYRNYTVDDGLPSSMIYHVFQDSKGYMWFATANGVSRFNGYKFENFDIQSGLVDNDVFEIFEDYKHRIWFIPMSGKLCYFENGKINTFKYNSKIKGHLPISRGPIKCSFHVDSLDYVYLSFKQFGLISISPEGVVRKFDDANSDVSVNAKELSNGKILVSCPNGENSNTITIVGKNQLFKTTLAELFNRKGWGHHHLFFIKTMDNHFVFSLFEKVFKVESERITCSRNIKADIIWMNVDDENNLWVSPIAGGVQCFGNADISKDPNRILLPDVQVSSVLKDAEGAYWFTTLNNGVFYCADLNFLNYSTKEGLVDNRVSSVVTNENGAYVGFKHGFVDLINKNSIKHFNASEFKVTNSFVHSLTHDSRNNKIWISSIDNLYWIENDKLNRISTGKFIDAIHPRKSIQSRGNENWVGTTRGLAKCDNGIIVYQSKIGDYAGMVYDLVEDRNGVVWFCTVNGLWTYSEKGYVHVGDSIPLLSQTSYSIIQNPIDSSIWIGTNGAGIVVKKGEKIYQITKKDGLISNSINQLYYTKKNVWVATKQGLSRILFKEKGIEIKNFSKANGLPTNEVSSVYEYKNIVYVGTSKGLTVFNKSSILDCKIPPNVIISNLTVEKLQIDPSIKADFSYDQNSLSIDFVGFVYRNAGKITYRYRMLGTDSAWVETQSPNCQYNGLTDGNYKFEVEAQSYNGIWSSNPATFSFAIHPPFWRRGWFLVLGAGVFTLLIFLVYKIRITEINRRNNLLQNINLYKQQSLRQQMNPHFIFNTLNSIQLYILEKDPINAHKYLTKFARLMRMTLDNSLYSTIPLRDEIEALKLYLDLEKLRLEDRFDYKIEYGFNESILNFKIPTLLIQPFVENAIWHGISLKKEQLGWVRISLVDIDNTIVCIVEDNGVGRKQAGEIRQMRNKDHKSRGSMITQQRIDLLTTMYKESFSIIYDDLLDAEGVPSGTKVTIVIPKEINN